MLIVIMFRLRSEIVTGVWCPVCGIMTEGLQSPMITLMVGSFPPGSGLGLPASSPRPKLPSKSGRAIYCDRTGLRVYLDGRVEVLRNRLKVIVWAIGSNNRDDQSVIYVEYLEMDLTPRS